MTDDVVNSTETVNGSHGTVDPSVITLDNSIQSPLPIRKDPPAFLTQQSIVTPSDLITYAGSPDIKPEEDTTPSAPPQDFSTSESPYGDAMDIESSPSPPASPQVIIPRLTRYNRLPYASNRTGLVYDVRMRFHAEPPNVAMPDDIHPEDPRRIHEIFDEIRKAGLVQGPDDSDEDAEPYKCYRIQIRHASRAEICLIHTEEHYDFIKSLQSCSEEDLITMAENRDSIYFHPRTFESATLAVGGAIQACRAVVLGQVRNAIAIIRPPGHHAESDAPSGFCIFNNVPIATRVCQDNFPEKCRKILILDWDVHHGNGVQHAFYDDPNVLYISLHVYKNAMFYPNSEDADHLHCGEGTGLGKNVNIPWADHGMGDGDYLYAFQEVVMPIAVEFDPDLVIVSAGFDAAEGDILGGCHVSPAGYAHMTHMLMQLAGGKIAVCLEGGYNLRSIARSALAVTKTLMLEPPERLADDTEAKPLGVKVVQMVKREQSKYWKCLYPKEYSQEKPLVKPTLRMHDLVREWQAKMMLWEHCMTPLTIKRRFISESFNHQVLATPYFMQAHPLLVIFHDPPEMMGINEPLSGKMELHNTWLTDVTKSYIDWAIKNGFQVLDVNLPKYITRKDDEGKYVEVDDPETRTAQARDLATYLWENYIEPHDATQVFFLGIGSAYTPLLELLGQTEACTQPDSIFKLFFAFVAESGISSIKRATDDNIGSWYSQHSRIFVANDHHVWDPNRTRKLRKKYGNLVRSNYTALEEMVVGHRDEVFEMLLDEKEAWEATDADSRAADDIAHGLRSPPLPSGTNTPAHRLNSAEPRAGSASASLKSPKMPPIGLFTVSGTPRSPRSPMKRTFRE